MQGEFTLLLRLYYRENRFLCNTIHTQMFLYGRDWLKKNWSVICFFHNSTYLSEMKFEVPLCYTSYITIGSPKWFIQCHKKHRSGRKQQKDLSPLQMKSWGTIWPRTERKPLRALYSVQVLSNTSPMLPFYQILLSSTVCLHQYVQVLFYLDRGLWKQHATPE